MNICIASEEQNRILNRKSSLVNIVYQDKGAALETILLQVRKILHENESVLMIVPEEDLRYELVNRLEQDGLSSMALVAATNSMIQPGELNLLKSKLSQQGISQPENKDALLNYRILLEDLKETLALKNATLYEKQNWRQVLDQYLSIDQSNDVLLVERRMEGVSLSYEDGEKEDLIQFIANGGRRYSTEFATMRGAVLSRELKREILSPEYINDVVFAISDFKSEAVQLQNRYLKYMSQLSHRFLKTQIDQHNYLERRLAELENQMIAWLEDVSKVSKSVIPGVISASAREYTLRGKKLIAAAESVTLKIREITEAPCLTLTKIDHELYNYFNEYRKVLRSSLQSIQQRRISYIKSVNRYNQDDEILRQLESDFNDLAFKMNVSNLFVAKVEFNTLSVNKQADIISELVSKLDHILLEASKSLHYLEWHQFIESGSTIESALLRSLQGIDPDRWVEVVDAWYGYRLLHKDYIQLRPTTTDYYDQLTTAAQLAKKYETEQWLNNNAHAVNKEVNKNIKKNAPELYKLVAGKKNPDLTDNWGHYISSHQELLETIFPVMILDQSSPLRLSKSPDRHLIVLQDNSVNPELMQLFKTVSYYWDHSLFFAEPDYRLVLSYEKSKLPHYKLSVSDRLPLLRSMSQLLLSTGKIPEIFLMKTSCIVSFSSRFVNQSIMKYLYHSGIKNIRQDDVSPEQMLTGALLPAQDHIWVVTEDGLMNTTSPDTILWQRNALALLQDMGCKIVHINSAELLQDPTLIEHIVDDIKGNQRIQSVSHAYTIAEIEE
ncbi:MAG: hypothetical protein J5I52_07525 [Saprospiraceae bacterium]|nr:MAG: hypothetical protein UZ09_BCD002001253 [Bacteroidetes bacterium OLB9]MCO6463983.1 hypothetical protein [Saprospiraceae bacterium]MCZ2339449.1 hypothetical protein [Chitinophagales bacterium]